MCGICGIYHNRNNKVDPDILYRMSRVLNHRGPDNTNIKILNNIGLGHARLSIIDLSDTANQPMSNEDETIWLTYNGEFYTFGKYRNELIKKGHVFKSETDSEVIIHLYEEYGLDFIKHLRGMYAFALWDKNKQELILVRDRVGIKPLFYYHDENTFLFASEIKSILEYPGINTDLDYNSLNLYFTLGYIPKENTIYKKIKKVLPANYLIFCNNQIETKPYWSLKVETHSSSALNAESKLEELLKEAVKMRMVSDVPIGVLLSGGVDSSLVATMMAYYSDKPIKTFSIGFNESKYNEIEHARKIAKHIGSDHYEFNVDIDKSDILEEIMQYFDEPFADSSAIPTYYVSKMSREYVKVVLSGDGGDELFGGYNWYDWMFKQASFNKIPSFIKRILSTTSRNIPFNFTGKHFIGSLELNEIDTYFERILLFKPTELKTLLNDNYTVNNISNTISSYYYSADSLLKRITLTDFNHYLPDDILTKVDRTSMAVSLETRVPLLDHKICEFAFSLPDDLKIRNGIKKHLLKQVAKRWLPSDFDFQRKQGFSIPQNEWLLHKYNNRILDLIENDNFLDKNYIKKLIQDHNKGKKSNTKILWPILIFLIWENNSKK